MSDELDDLASAARTATNRNAPSWAIPRPYVGPPPRQRPAALPASTDGAAAFGFNAALGAAVPLFVVIVFAILAATWIIKETIKADFSDAIQHRNVR